MPVLKGSWGKKLTIAIADNILWVKLTNNRAVPIHVDVFRSIRRQQLEQQAHVEADMDLENVVRQSQAEHYEPNSTNIEVDSDENHEAPTYRVWLSWHFLGSFHQSPVDNRWITHPTYGRDYNRHGTSDEAIAAIVSALDVATHMRNADPAIAGGQ